MPNDYCNVQQILSSTDHLEKWSWTYFLLWSEVISPNVFWSFTILPNASTIFMRKVLYGPVGSKAGAEDNLKVVLAEFPTLS